VKDFLKKKYSFLFAALSIKKAGLKKQA